MTEPRTKAGKALLDDFDQYAMHDPTIDGSPRTYAFDRPTLKMWVLAIEAEASAVPEGLPLPIMPEDLGRTIADRLYTTGLIERDDRDDAQAIVRAALAARLADTATEGEDR